MAYRLRRKPWATLANPFACPAVRGLSFARSITVAAPKKIEHFLYKNAGAQGPRLRFKSAPAFYATPSGGSRRRAVVIITPL